MATDKNKLDDLFGDNWGSELDGDLDFGEDTEDAFSDESEDSNDLNEDEESDETNAEDSDGENSDASDGEDDDSDSGDSDIDPVESRFQSLESSVEKVTNLLEQIATKLNGQSVQPKEEELDDDDDSPLTRKELKKMMREAALEAVKPINEKTKEQQEAVVVNKLLAKYGESFKAAVPAMKKILAINPDLGVQGAWDFVNEIKGTKQVAKPKATKQDSDSKKVLPKKKGDAANLREKAANLSTAKGVSGTNKDKKRAAGIDDILKLSWDEVFEERG